MDSFAFFVLLAFWGGIIIGMIIGVALRTMIEMKKLQVLSKKEAVLNE